MLKNNFLDNLSSRTSTPAIDAGVDVVLIRKLIILYSFLCMTLIIFIFFGSYNLYRGETNTAILDFLGFCISLFSMWRLYFYQQHELAIVISITAIFFILLAIAYLTQNESYSLIWTFCFPIYAIMVAGRTKGLTFVVPYYAILFVMAYVNIGEWHYGSWDNVSFIRFCCASLVITYSVYYNETSLEKAHAELARSAKREQDIYNEKERMSKLLLEQKNRFLADISHELRTPLTALRVNLELLEDKVIEDPQKIYSILYSRFDGLNQLVNDLHALSLSDLGLMQFEMEKIDIPALLEEIINSFTSLASKENISIYTSDEIRQPIEFFGDKQRITQVFVNIITNSLRYTYSGGELHINIKSNSDSLSIGFEDTAPGVSSEQLPHIFERFYRIECSRNRKMGGSGLGLSICKSIVEAHNGIISASHSERGGLAIHIQFQPKVS